MLPRDSPAAAPGTALRAASYARQSTQQQRSVPTQLVLCRRLIDERGWRETHRLHDDALRGRDASRPGYQRLLELAGEKRINVIVVWKLDRLVRSLTEASAAEEFLRDHGVSLVSVTEPFDTTTTTGRFIFGFLANVAQFETDLLRERAQLGHQRRLMEGKWTGSHVPFGYWRRPDGLLEAANEEVKVLKLMHRQYARVGGDRRLAQWLNQHHHSHRGQPWTTDRCRRALTNRIAIGELSQYGVSATHPELSIMTTKKFETTQRQRREVQARGTQHAEADRAMDRIMEAYLAHLGEDFDDAGESP